MGRVIVMEFVSLDGITEDPDGSGKTPQGGWMFRHGPHAVAGDKFGLGEILDTGVMLLGRRTWELFAGIWPGRTDEFSAKMNALPKLVASRSLDRTDAWQNSSVLKTDLPTAVQEHKTERDIMVTGSTSVVRELAARDLIDEYRLLIFPLTLGAGRRLFPDSSAPVDLTLVSAETAGPLARLIYTRQPDPHSSS